MMEPKRKTWHLWIGGRWQPAKSYEPLYDPYTGKKIADIAWTRPEEATEAIVEAHRAFQSFKATLHMKERRFCNRFVLF